MKHKKKKNAVITMGILSKTLCLSTRNVLWNTLHKIIMIFENTSYSAMLNIAELIPPPESWGCGCEFKRSRHTPTPTPTRKTRGLFQWFSVVCRRDYNITDRKYARKIETAFPQDSYGHSLERGCGSQRYMRYPYFRSYTLTPSYLQSHRHPHLHYVKKSITCLFTDIDIIAYRMNINKLYWRQE
jgi:hypothetical protein